MVGSGSGRALIPAARPMMIRRFDQKFVNPCPRSYFKRKNDIVITIPEVV